MMPDDTLEQGIRRLNGTLFHQLDYLGAFDIAFPSLHVQQSFFSVHMALDWNKESFLAGRLANMGNDFLFVLDHTSGLRIQFDWLPDLSPDLDDSLNSQFLVAFVQPQRTLENQIYEYDLPSYDPILPLLDIAEPNNLSDYLASDLIGRLRTHREDLRAELNPLPWFFGETLFDEQIRGLFRDLGFPMISNLLRDLS